MARVLVISFFVAASFSPAGAAAQRCEESEAWVRQCGEDDVAVELVRCLPGGVVVATTAGGERLEVEIARDRPDAFQQVAGLGVSPIAEYPDFREAPEGVRRGFAVVVDCVERDSSLAIPEGSFVPGGREAVPVPTPFPALLLGALVAMLAAAGVFLFRERPASRVVLRALAVPLAIVAATMGLRAALSSAAFVHQNGQGPLWVSHALCVTPVYGPGYHEVFGLVVESLGGEPSAAVFFAQSLLGALGAAMAWAIARGVGADRRLSLVLAVAVAAEPAFARLAQSESYFGAIASLLLVAGGVLALGAHRGRARDPVLLLSVVAAGLLVAQAARIHPVAWVPSATLPVIVVVSRGRLRRRLACAAVAAAGIGAIAALFAVGVIGDVAGGDVGGQWLPSFFERIPKTRLKLGLLVGLVGGVFFAAAAADRRRGALRGVAFFAVIAATFVSHIIGAVGPLIITAYVLLFVPGMVATVAAGLANLRRGRVPAWVPAAALAALLLAWGGVRADGLLELPTDAREQAWLLTKRSDLPARATVVFLGAVGPRRRLHVPFYGECPGVGGPSARPLSDESIAAGSRPEPGAIWYRSSLCNTDDGRPLCEAVERELHLVAIDTADLPAIPSMDGLDYDRETVHVGLYRVEDGR